MNFKPKQAQEERLQNDRSYFNTVLPPKCLIEHKSSRNVTLFISAKLVRIKILAAENYGGPFRPFYYFCKPFILMENNFTISLKLRGDNKIISR